MIARRFEDLIVWQLASRLEQEVFAFTEIECTKRDFKYCNQVREASRSAVRNIAEGFGRYSSSPHHERLKRLCLRAIKANNRLMAYLATAEAPEPFAGTPNIFKNVQNRRTP